MNNITTYNILSKYYKYIFNHQVQSDNSVNNYLDFIINNLEIKQKFLDIGCGTGIFTEKLFMHFKISYGIDPCKDMLEQVKFNSNIKYKNLYLNDFKDKNFDLITSFSQVINHLKNYDDLFNFIKDSSEKLNENGLFYFDVFNNKYFDYNKPNSLKRELEKNIYYSINPEKLEKFNDYTLMILNNFIYDNSKKYQYKLDIYMWDIDLLLKICELNNLKLINITKMLNLNEKDINNSHKISLLFKKMKRIDLIPNKKINKKNINNLLSKSSQLKTLTNYGPNVQYLEYYLKKILFIDDSKSIIVTNNGSSALQTLALGIQKYENNFNEWTTQSFTFVSAHQGSLNNSYIVDIDDNNFLNLDLVDENTIGILVTNIFGNICEISKYEKWAKDNNKLLIFDNAATPFTFYNNKNSINFGVGSIISFHHTKLLGYGEGGAIIVDKKYENIIRSLINFKLNENEFDNKGNNFKMSDINACYIIDYLKNFNNIVKKNINLYKYFLKSINKINHIKLYNKYYDNNKILIGLLPLIFENENMSLFYMNKLKENNIFSKKYYKPLDNSLKSNILYEKILCIPFHYDLNKDDINKIINLLTSKPII